MGRTLYRTPLLISVLGIAMTGCTSSPSSSPSVRSSPDVATAEVRQATQTVEAPDPVQFSSCVSDLKKRAADRRISPQIVTVLDTVQPDERVLNFDRRQPEFVQTFWDYIDKRVTQARIDTGRRLLIENSGLLNAVHVRYGVPPAVLVSFWGLESNYGTMTGSMEVIRSLTTLACDGRRSTMFAGELMSALEISDAGDADIWMKGSWAGAIGQTQFMPSTFQKFAVDGDGDGRRDLWGNLPDVFASSANFLRALGWRNGQKWGEEIRLPAKFDLAQARSGNRKPLSYWKSMGVTAANGGVPAADAAGNDVLTAIVLPMGVQGPAFAVYPNFDVIMKWNRSTNYAIAVGHLSDRILGGGPLVVTPPETSSLRVSEVIEVQERLNALGYNAGEADGTVGPITSAAISEYQKSQNLPADGYPDRDLLQRLR